MISEPEIDCLRYADKETDSRAEQLDCLEVVLSY
jgi:hypothetical protein